jgi:hypothetical protein
MSYGKGRFSNLDLPDPTLQYVARKAFRHHDLEFRPGDPVSAAQIGDRFLVKYIRARLVELPAPGEVETPATVLPVVDEEPDAVEPEIAPAAIDAPSPEPVLIEKPAPVEVEPPKAPEPAKHTPKATKAQPVTAAQVEAMHKPELLALIAEHDLPIDSRLPLGATRLRVIAALKL